MFFIGLKKLENSKIISPMKMVQNDNFPQVDLVLPVDSMLGTY